MKLTSVSLSLCICTNLKVMLIIARYVKLFALSVFECLGSRVDSCSFFCCVEWTQTSINGQKTDARSWSFAVVVMRESKSYAIELIKTHALWSNRVLHIDYTFNRWSFANFIKWAVQQKMARGNDKKVLASCTMHEPNAWKLHVHRFEKSRFSNSHACFEKEISISFYIRCEHITKSLSVYFISMKNIFHNAKVSFSLFCASLLITYRVHVLN